MTLSGQGVQNPEILKTCQCHIRNLRKKCCRMRWSRALLVPVEGLLWPWRRGLPEGFSAGPRKDTMANSESTQEMLQNAMVESSTGARSRSFVAMSQEAEGGLFCCGCRQNDGIFDIYAGNAAECDGRELRWSPLKAFCSNAAES